MSFGIKNRLFSKGHSFMDVLILIFLLLWSRICNNKNMEKHQPEERFLLLCGSKFVHGNLSEVFQTA